MFDSNIDFIDDYIRPQYICIKPYETIKLNDKVAVSIGTYQVCVTSGKFAYFISDVTLDEYFKKEE